MPEGHRRKRPRIGELYPRADQFRGRQFAQIDKEKRMPKVSFATDIKPLFRPVDISHMKPHGIKLDDYTYMSNPDNANSCACDPTER